MDRQPAPDASTPRLELTVLVPALNEAENLRMLLPDLRAVLEELGVGYEILVVDGGSSDDTESVARELSVRFLRQTERGYGGALMDGFREARGDYVLTMDADYSHEPSFVRSLWEARRSAELLIASRYVRGGRADMSWFRLFLSRLLNGIYRRVLELRPLDLSSGYRLYRLAALREIQPVGRAFDFLPEVLVRLLAEGYKVRELPFHYRPRREGRSHVMLFRFAFAYLGTLVRLRRVRTSVSTADYDDRAFDSWIPLQSYWQRKRHEIVLRYLEPELDTLDVGCGSSKIIQTLANGVGFDFQQKKLRFLRDRAPAVVRGSMTRLPFRDECFPQLVCSEVIEHVPHEAVDLHELRRVLRPGGTLVIGTPDYSSWIWVTLEKIHGWVFPGGYADEHINPYTEDSLRKELEASGFVVDDLRKICRAEMIFRAIKK